jgi:hypothetical protein
MSAIRTALPAALAALALAVCATPAMAAPEAPETIGPAKAITGTTAELTGVLNPHSTAKAGWFFAYNQGISCAGGPTTPQEGEVEGEALPEHAEVTGLEPSREYTFCLVATNEAAETTFGLPEVSFKTLDLAPAVDGSAASSITPFAATLEAQLNPENQATTSCVIEYGTTMLYGNTVACEPETLEGFGDQGVSHRIEGLEAATTYHFRALVTNATGTTAGPDSEFTTSTLEAPLIDGQSVSAVTSTDAQLEAQVNPNYQETTYAFEYALDEALTGATTVPGAGPLAAGFGDQSVSVDLANALQPGTKYFYRALATNATGTTPGPVQSFITVGPPLVTTGVAQALTRSSAQLHGGSIDPVGAPVTYYYRYIDEAGYEQGLAENPANPYAKGASTLPFGHLPAGYGAQPTSVVPVEELTPATTYHFALVAVNSAGSTTGPDATFTTLAPTPPGASAGPLLALSHTSATIAAGVQPNGLDATWQLQIASEPGAFNTVAAGSVTASSGASNLTLPLSFLVPGVTYQYRMLATNQDGTAISEVGTFTTEAFPPPQGLPSIPGPVAFTTIAQPETNEPKTTPSTTRSTRAQKLARALKACAKKPRHQRKACQRQARQHYGAAHHTSTGR